MAGKKLAEKIKFSRGLADPGNIVIYRIRIRGKGWLVKDLGNHSITFVPDPGGTWDPVAEHYLSEYKCDLGSFDEDQLAQFSSKEELRRAVTNEARKEARRK